MIFQLKCQVVVSHSRWSVLVEWIYWIPRVFECSNILGNYTPYSKSSAQFNSPKHRISLLLDGLLCNKSHNHVTILSREKKSFNSALSFCFHEYEITSHILLRYSKELEKYIISNNSALKMLHNFFFKVVNNVALHHRRREFCYCYLLALCTSLTKHWANKLEIYKYGNILWVIFSR